MGVVRIDTTTVVDQHGPAVTPESLSAAGKNHATACAREHATADRRCDVQSFMKTAPSISERGSEDSSGHRKPESGDMRVLLAPDSFGKREDPLFLLLATLLEMLLPFGSTQLGVFVEFV
jgi:hypothetical protein